MMQAQDFQLIPFTARQRGDKVINAMSVDVEEHFQVQALSRVVRREDWDQLPSRVEMSTHRVLDLFGEAGVKATFFVLGWVAERHPALIKRIVLDGHELASHGYEHIRVTQQSPAEFRADVRRTKMCLEDLGGTHVAGYRAATFSIDQQRFWAFPILQEEGYLYSSSIAPVAHDLYGIPGAPRAPFYPSGPAGIAEYPVATVRFAERNWPCGGGFFRLLPYTFSRTAIGRINGHDRLPAMFYFHPWEVDPEQPRHAGLSLKSRFRHYTNLKHMASRLSRLVRDFAWDRIDRVYHAPV